MDAGDYVPDSLTNALVADRLAEADAADGFLLDGYPRTAAAGRRTSTTSSPGRAPASTPSSGWSPTTTRSSRGSQACARAGSLPTTPKRPSATARTSTPARPPRSSRSSRPRAPVEVDGLGTDRRGRRSHRAALAERGIGERAWLLSHGLPPFDLQDAARAAVMMRPGLLTAAALAAVRADPRPASPPRARRHRRGDDPRAAASRTSSSCLATGTPCASRSTPTSCTASRASGARPGRHRLRRRRAEVAAGTATPRSRSSCRDPARSDLVAAAPPHDVTEQSLWHGIAALARRGTSTRSATPSRTTSSRRATTASSPTTSVTASAGDARGAAGVQLPGGAGPDVKPGLVVAIEPMITAGDRTFTRDDDWTVATADGGWPRTGSTPSPCTPTASGCSPPPTAGGGLAPLGVWFRSRSADPRLRRWVCPSGRGPTGPSRPGRRGAAQ